MVHLSVIVLCLHIVSISMAPMKERLFQPMQSLLQPMEMIQSQQTLQQQLLSLQQLQALQTLNTVHAPSTLYLPQPMLFVFPNTINNQNIQMSDKLQNANEHDLTENENLHNLDNEYVDEELDSVVINAKTNEKVNEQSLKRGIILFPNGRFSIGEFISGIPWLPFEINVPDTITWAYNGVANGIAGIISIIGQRLPFRPRPQKDDIMKVKLQEPNVKTFLKSLMLGNKNQMAPMLMLPIDRVLPINAIMIPENGIILPLDDTMPMY